MLPEPADLELMESVWYAWGVQHMQWNPGLNRFQPAPNGPALVATRFWSHFTYIGASGPTSTYSDINRQAFNDLSPSVNEVQARRSNGATPFDRVGLLLKGPGGASPVFTSFRYPQSDKFRGAAIQQPQGQPTGKIPGWVTDHETLWTTGAPQRRLDNNNGSGVCGANAPKRCTTLLDAGRIVDLTPQETGHDPILAGAAAVLQNGVRQAGQTITRSVPNAKASFALSEDGYIELFVGF
ncbi:MAG TPA: hypothetical protein VM286_04515 [Candidatus Thermoplasmatota archaeon]|nr:hypothetical protein [Candidatus Thermoplasmatota archaeon]